MIIKNYFEGKENLSIEELKEYKNQLLLDFPDELMEISISFQEFLDTKNSKKNSYKIGIERIRIGVANSTTRDTKCVAKVEGNELSIFILDKSSISEVEEINDNQFMEVESLSNGKVVFKI